MVRHRLSFNSGLAAWLVLFAAVQSAAAQPGLASGPMVGYATEREVAVWVQTAQPARVRLKWWPLDDPAGAQFSEPVQTFSAQGHTAHLRAEYLAPGTTYRYQVELNGALLPAVHRQSFQTLALWQWRGDPPPVRFALGSCAFVNEAIYDRPGKPYGSHYEVFGKIPPHQPDFMLWLGDNTYLREVDWNSRSGIYARHGHTRALPQMAALLAGTHHYAVWDDHDYGPDNADRSFWNKALTLEAFKDFWANPNWGLAGGGITGTFHWADAQFFLLDNRWFRSNNDRVTGVRQVFGPEQVQWLIDALSFSKAAFKFVVSPGAFLYDRVEEEAAIRVAPEERQQIIDLITAERIPGVLFLSGDEHYSRLIEYPREGTYPLYEWTVSALTAGGHTPGDPSASNIVAGSVVVDNNFGIAEISGPRNDRRLSLRIYGWDGSQRWQRDIRATDLCHPAACETGH